ncbi:MAG: MFS transporter [Bacteroidales bacterium]|nr:MFS transporter [Bacteroidales bacterium]
MDKTMTRSYTRWEWRTILLLMLGYALYYFVRKNLSVAIPAMEAQLGLTKVQLGIFLTIHGIIYGLSRFVNGIIVDRTSQKKIMALGLLLSALVNLLICFSPKLDGLLHLLDTEGKATLTLTYLIGSLWVLNGYLQGMGVPPCISLLAHWIKPSELATKQSIWNASHSLGAGLVVVICGFLLRHFGYEAWHLCFLVPALIALLGVPVIFLGIKDSPTELGFPPVEEMDKAGRGQEAGSGRGKVHLSGSQYKRVVRKMVYANPYLWILALTNFCIYVMRGTVLDWGSSFLTQFKGLEIAKAASVIGICELVGGILGMLVAGWATDKVFGGKGHRTCFIATVLAVLCFLGFWKSSSTGLSLALLVGTSFFIYGPQALLGMCVSQQVTRYATGTGNGIMGVFGYASTAISGILFGRIADVSGWDTVFLYTIIFGLAAAVIIALMWKAPADAYDKVEKLIAQEGTQE